MRQSCFSFRCYNTASPYLPYLCGFVCAQAAERRARERAEKEADAAASALHASNVANSAMLTEARGQSYAVTGPARYRPDHFKGFSQQEADAVRAEQAKQREEALVCVM